MRDSGAIYTLSAQPGSSIERNRVEGVGTPLNNPVMWENMTHSQFDLYTDEGTDFYTVKDNWLERGEISRNRNGAHNRWGLNGPEVSDSVRSEAGVQPPLPSSYRHRDDSLSSSVPLPCICLPQVR